MTLPRHKSRLRQESWGGSGRLTRHPALLLAITLSFSIALGVTHNRLQQQERTDPVTGGVRTLLYPFQRGAALLSGGINISWDWLFGGKRLAEENARLRAEVDRLRLENETLRLKADEADRLRTVLKFLENNKKPPRLAPVIAWLPSPRSDTITIGMGSRDSIKPRAVVRTPAGLVGQVTEIGPVSSQTLLLTDLQSRVGGMVLRGGKPLGFIGIVRGTGRGQPLEMVYLKKEDNIRPGDIVYSSGHGGVFPRDIPIGVVTQVTEDKARFTKSARLTPYAANPADLREVLVVQ